MRIDTLDFLRCPFCGTAFDVVDNEALVRRDDHIEAGVLGCQCCAFPVVGGIPVLIADDRTREAMHALEAGHPEAALLSLLGLDTDDRQRAFRTVMAGDRPTYRAAQDVLSPDAEGTYFIYRFSDPTYLMSRAVLRAVAGAALARTAPGDAAGREAAPRPSRIIDVCGGSGHLTRDLAASVPGVRVTLADVYFWKLWLARTFTVPECDPVCCDANAPLPFTRRSFDMVVLSDAFPYIWHKRALADNLMRLAGPDGVLAMPHLHSSLGFNFSAGMTLTPAAYADLFAPMSPRLFRDSDLLNGVLDRQVADLSEGLSPEAVGEEPSVTLVASPRDGVFRRHVLPDAAAPVAGELAVNPLYRVERTAEGSVLTLTFPTTEYEEEFGGCRRYLPDSVRVPCDLTGAFTAEQVGDQLVDLRRRHVVLDVPLRYC